MTYDFFGQMLAVGKRHSIEICLSLLMDILSEQDLLKASAVGVQDESCEMGLYLECWYFCYLTLHWAMWKRRPKKSQNSCYAIATQ